MSFYDQIWTEHRNTRAICQTVDTEFETCDIVCLYYFVLPPMYNIFKVCDSAPLVELGNENSFSVHCANFRVFLGVFSSTARKLTRRSSHVCVVLVQNSAHPQKHIRNAFGTAMS